MTEQQTTHNSNSMMTEPQANQSGFDSSSIFSSQDFGKFLSKEFPSSSAHLSMDVSLGSLEETSAFKSVDAFSHLFSGDDWGMKLKQDSFAAPRNDVPLVDPSTSMKEPFQTVLTSKDWMPSLNLGPHMDVRFDRSMILSRESSTGASVSLDLLGDLPPIKTPWDKMYMSQLQLLLPQTSPEEEPASLDNVLPWTGEGLELSSSVDSPVISIAYSGGEEPSALVQLSPDVSGNNSSDMSGKKKRKRRPRPKVVPNSKEYVEPKTNDVLLGRGGRSNHHPGNKRYREEVKNLREWYGSIGDNKEEKTKLSQTLVDRIQENDGRFLEKDSEGWYVVPNVVARRKASQALREDDDPDKRAAKRQRFLEKRALENEMRSLENGSSQEVAV